MRGSAPSSRSNSTAEDSPNENRDERFGHCKHLKKYILEIFRQGIHVSPHSVIPVLRKIMYTNFLIKASCLSEKIPGDRCP